MDGDDRYTGRVVSGGDPQVRTLWDSTGTQLWATVTKVAVGPMANNAYLIACAASGQVVLVDAAADAETLLELVDGRQLSVVTTHRHADHWQALEVVRDRSGASSAAHVLDRPEITPTPDIGLEHGGIVRAGEVRLDVVHLGGHTPGSIALALVEPAGRAHLFTGDGLFPGGVGNTWGDAERFTELLGNVERRLFAMYADDTWVYPGHGDDTTLGAERPRLGEWRARGW